MTKHRRASCAAEAFQAMLGNPAAPEHMDKAAAPAVGLDPQLYTVESVHHTPRP